MSQLMLVTSMKKGKTLAVHMFRCSKCHERFDLKSSAHPLDLTLCGHCVVTQAGRVVEVVCSRCSDEERRAGGEPGRNSPRSVTRVINKC